MPMKTNDLMDFMNSSAQDIENEYIRIQKRATEDPGTAGDQGEENWATLLRNWLPPIFQVVTKGRILSHKGIASPQVDVIILRPEYPRHLLDKKLFLAGGVLAAFECKLTLTAQHIEDFIKNSLEIRAHLEEREGSPYKELQSSIIYGLLAHSHSWRAGGSTPIDNIEKKIWAADAEFIHHPIQMPDLFCVADLAFWTTFKIVFIGPKFSAWSEVSKIYGPNAFAASTYVCFSKQTSDQIEHFNPVATMIIVLMNKLCWEYPNLRPLSEYFTISGLQGAGATDAMRKWDASIYSDEIRNEIELENLKYELSWDEWQIII